MKTLILLQLATIFHLVFDYHKLHSGHPIRHWMSATIVVAISVVLGFIDQIRLDHTWWQFAIFSLSIHLALFDFLWNIINKKDLFYFGDPNNPERAWTDKVWSRVPPLGQIFFRSCFLYVGYAVYYHWDLIVAK